MNEGQQSALTEVAALVAEYRSKALWFLRPDYTPATNEEALRILDLVERYGDKEAFHRSRRLRQWLLPECKVKS